MKVNQFLVATSLLSLTMLGGALAQETPETPSAPGAAISQAARQGGGRAIADVARENAPGTARSEEARAAAGQPDAGQNEDANDNENSGIGADVSAFAKDAQGEGVSDFVLENSPGIAKANEVRADLPPASVPAARPTLPSTARATLPTLPTRPARPQLPTVPPRH